MWASAHTRGQAHKVVEVAGRLVPRALGRKHIAGTHKGPANAREKGPQDVEQVPDGQPPLEARREGQLVEAGVAVALVRQLVVQRHTQRLEASRWW